MSILSQLQSRKLGLVDLLFMGFDVCLDNLQPILMVLITTWLSAVIISLPLGLLMIKLFSEVSWQNSPSGLLLALFMALFATTFLLFSIVLIVILVYFFVGISLITDNAVNERNTSYQSIVNKTISNIIPLFFLGLRFFLNCLLRVLPLLIPVIISAISDQLSWLLLIPIFYIATIILILIYAVKNHYYGLAFILRDKKGKEAFAYSRSLVKGNWWRVFFFGFLVLFVLSTLQSAFTMVLSSSPYLNNIWFTSLAAICYQLVVIGTNIGGILLFLNLEFQKRKTVTA